jgi:hypothetical protein
MRCGPAQPGRTGTPTCHGFCSASGPHGGKIRSSLQPRQCLEHSRFSRASFSTHQSRRRQRSSKSCSEHTQQQNPTSGGPPQPPRAAQSSRGAHAHPLGTSSPRWGAASPVADVRRAVLGSGKVSTLLQTSGGNEARYRLNSSPQTLQVAAGCAACRSPSPGRPPTSPAAASPPADVPRPPAPRRRRVTFRCPVVFPPPESSPPPLLHPSGRPARRSGRPQRYLSSLDASAWGGRVDADGINDDILYRLQ